MAFLDETGLAELWSLIQAEDAEVVANGVKMAKGSYEGTGTYGESNPNSLTFEFKPKVFILNYATGSRVTLPIFYGATNMYVCINAVSNVLGGLTLDLTWSGNTVSWYGSSAIKQLNESGKTYNYIAIG